MEEGRQVRLAGEVGLGHDYLHEDAASPWVPVCPRRVPAGVGWCGV
jgi:hypothetical protein